MRTLSNTAGLVTLLLIVPFVSCDEGGSPEPEQGAEQAAPQDPGAQAPAGQTTQDVSTSKPEPAPSTDSSGGDL